MSGGNHGRSSPLRGAIIGFGNVAIHAHLPVWRKSGHFRIDAIVEPRPDRVGLAKKLMPKARVYSEMERVIAAHDLDFVDICTPPVFHADLMHKACRSGMHVFCEKPLVVSLESLQAVQRAARKYQRVIFSVNNWKYAPIWTKAVQLIRENKIGAVRSLCLSVLRPPQCGGGVTNWRRCAEVAGGGILLDHGWHHLYMVLSIMQEAPLSVSAKMQYSQADGSPLEDAVDMLIRFPTAEARLHLSWRATCRRNHGIVRGERGTLSVNDDHLVLHPNDSPPVCYEFPEPLSGGSHHAEWMKPVVEEFRREVLDPDARGTNLTEAGWCALMTDLAYRSHREGSRFINVGDPVSDSFPACAESSRGPVIERSRTR